MDEVKTSEEIKIMLDEEHEKIYPHDFNEGYKIYKELMQKKWIPADKAVLIEDVEKMIKKHQTKWLDWHNAEEICIDLLYELQKLNSLKGK
ncbi:MAG: hypothetical protein AABY22_31730 [Nanoarchaeota archaeon]